MILNWVFIGLPIFVMFMTFGLILIFFMVHLLLSIRQLNHGRKEKQRMDKPTIRKRALEFIVDSLMFLVLIGIVTKLLTFMLVALEGRSFL